MHKTEWSCRVTYTIPLTNLTSNVNVINFTAKHFDMSIRRTILTRYINQTKKQTSRANTDK